MRMQVRSPALLSGLRIQRYYELWCRPAATGREQGSGCNWSQHSSQVIWQRRMFGQFCQDHTVFSFLSVLRLDMEWSCFCLVPSPSQSDLVTGQRAVKFFLSNRRTPGPSHQSRPSSKPTAATSCWGVVFFVCSGICSTIPNTCLRRTISRVGSPQCNISKDPNP